MAIICRVGYCKTCANLRNPRTGQIFLAYGSTRKNYFVVKAERNGIIGFVPFIYKAKFNGQNVIIEKSCAMYGCGVERRLEKSNGYNYWFYYVKEFTREIWTLETYNALVLLKHDLFTKDFEI